MSVFDYVLAITALCVFLVQLLLLGKWCSERLWRSVAHSDEPPRLWPDGYDERELVQEPLEGTHASLPLMAEEEDESDKPSLDWRDRAEVIDGEGRRLRVVRDRSDLHEVPSLNDAPELGDRCPHGEAVPSKNIMPPKGA